MNKFDVKKAGWSRTIIKSSGTTDPKVTFYCNEELIDLLENSGDYYSITIEPLNLDAPEIKKTKPSQLAAIIGQDSDFPAFIRAYFTPQVKAMMASGLWEGTAEEKCAAFIRFVCSIESRSELDTEGAAMDIFFTSIYEPFQSFVKGHTA